MNLQKKLEYEFKKQMEDLDDHTIGLAVSGGGDSIAMLNLASEWAYLKKKSIKVVTVNHNLRNEAKKEAIFTSETASYFFVSSFVNPTATPTFP